MDVGERPAVDRLRAMYARRPELYSALATVAVGAILLAIGVDGVWSTFAAVDPDAVSIWWHVAILAGGFLALLARRRHPMLALAAGTALFVVDVVLGGTLGMLIVLFDLLYAAAYWGGPRARRALLALIAAVIVVSFAVPIAFGEDVQLIVLFGLQSFAILATPYWWASAVRRGRELAASEAARADDAQRLATLDREQALRDERARMAQDLHDVIAGNLSAIAIHSEAALSREPDGSRDRTALAAVRAASVEGLEQMRSMIALLRTGDDALSAPARLADLDGLVAASGLDVDVAGHVPALPTAADQSLARIIAEALRNAARHRPGSHVTISFATDAGANVVRVRSAGGHVAAAAPATGTGHGIHLMRERAEQAGGTLAAGPDGDGWLVEVRIPGARMPEAPTPEADA